MIIGVLGANGEGKTSWILKFIKSKRLRAYRVDLSDKPFGIDKDEWFERVCLQILENPRFKGSWIVFDDLDNFSPRMGSLFDDIVIRARHIPVHIIYAARRPKGFTRNLLVNTHYLVMFHITFEDLKFLEMLTGASLPAPPPRGSHRPKIIRL